MVQKQNYGRSLSKRSTVKSQCAYNQQFSLKIKPLNEQKISLIKCFFHVTSYFFSLNSANSQNFA